jgi:hypothetical protein
VFWARTSAGQEPEVVEGRLLAFFTRNVSLQTRDALRDRDRPFPFANLEHPRGNRKVHGIRGSVLSEP